MTASLAAPRGRLLFFALASLAGALGTWTYNLRFMQSHSGVFSLGAFIDEAFVTSAAGSLSVDILVAAFVGVVWMLGEAKRLGMKHAWVYVVLACSVAFAAAFPLFLLMRELKLAELARDTTAGAVRA